MLTIFNYSKITITYFLKMKIVKTVKSVVLRHLPVNLKVFLCKHKFQQGALTMTIYNGESYSELLNSALNTYLTKEELQDEKCVQRVIHDALACYFKYKVKPNEYFNFDFQNKTNETRLSYICDEERVMALLQVEGTAGKMELRDKWAFYQKAKPFFKREIFHLTSQTNLSEYLLFVRKTKAVFCKPNTGAMGMGVHFYEIDNENSAKTVFTSLLSECDDWVIEEKIVQSNQMSEWNDSSINTVRFPSFLKDGKFTAYYPKLRVGRKGEIVDNFAQGGMIAMIDALTGVISTNAYTKDKKQFVCHPDSGKMFVNSQIPDWKELLECVEKLHRTMPQHIYVAWDMAHTNKGWDVVEANWGQLGSTQMMLGHGIKQEFYSMIGYE